VPGCQAARRCDRSKSPCLNIRSKAPFVSMQSKCYQAGHQQRCADQDEAHCHSGMFPNDASFDAPRFSRDVW
jgi:hypothetical protein